MALQVTFTSGSTSVTVTRGVDQSSDFWKEKRNTIRRETLDGSVVGASNGPEIIRGILDMKYITKTEADALRDFFVQTVQFVRPFNITIYTGADIGAGDGATLTAYWDGDPSTQGVIVPNGRGLKYNVTLPYLSTDLVGVGSGVGVAD